VITPGDSAAGWRARLALHYRRDGEATLAHDRHEGPLRVLKRLYPEGPSICHHVLVHPPGGVVGGDELHVDVRLEEGAHALITTPGATRFYGSDGAAARQSATLQLASGARLEWLPLETLAHPGCRATSSVRAALAPGAEMMGWDVLSLGLPASGKPFTSGEFTQHLELPGVWLERGRVAATDTVLLDGPTGWAGRRTLATLWWACGSALPTARRTALLDAARAVMQAHPLATSCGVTAAQNSVLVLRALATQVEPAMQLLTQVRAAWRQEAWGLGGEVPRVWRT
jgi:urease accessory protein